MSDMRTKKCQDCYSNYLKSGKSGTALSQCQYSDIKPNTAICNLILEHESE